MKKLVKICLAFAIACSTTSIIQINYNNEEVAAKTFQNFIYEEKKDGVFITYYSGKDEIVNVPSMIDDKPVIGIESKAFAECRGVKEIVLPDTIKTIESFAFSKCTELEKVTIPNSVSSLGTYIFNDCISLKTVNLPKNISTVPEGMFSGCKELKSIALHDGLEVIGNAAFKDCTSLVNVELPNTLKKIDAYAFMQCVKLVNVTLPDNLTSLGNYAFSKCSSLQNINLPESLTGIGESAFFNCVNLNNVTIPNSISIIASSTFSGCSSLSTIKLPDGLTSINTAAFSACSSLEYIDLPEGLKNIGESAFAACSKLKEMNFPSSVTEIGVNAFSDCDSIVSIAIPSKVSTLSAETFRNCDKLQYVVIPDSVNEIGNYAFADCPSLETVIMPASIQESRIATGIFNSCPKLTVVVKANSGAYTYCLNNMVNYHVIENQIEISQSKMDLRKGTSKELSIITSNGVVVDNSKIKWESNNSQVATVKNGIVTGIAVGEATISATYNRTKVNCKVNVNDTRIPIESLEIKGNSSGSVDRTILLTTEINPEDTTDDKTITWESSDPAKAIVNGSGVVQLLEPGEVTITASVANGVKAEHKISIKSPITSVEISPNTKQTMYVGNSFQFRASVSPVDTTDDKTISWESSNPKVAIVDQSGNVTALTNGQTTIRVKSSNGKVATCMIDVREGQVIPITGVELNYETADLKVSETIKLTASILPENTTESKTVTWESSNPEIAAVSSDGVVTAKKTGDAVITVTTSNNLKDTCLVHVSENEIGITGVELNKDKLSLTEGMSETLIATILPADTTMDKTLKWSSDNPSVATVDQQGKVTGVVEGEATITVETINGKTAICFVSVKKKEIPIDSVSLDKTEAVLRSGNTLSLTASINPENTTMDKALEWSSNNPSVATVDQQGKVTAVGKGEAVITVKTVNGKTATCKVTVFTVSLDALNKTIEDAEKLDANRFTASTYQNLSLILAEAKEVQNDKDATQLDIDTAQKKLQSAIDGLVIRASEAEVSELQAKVLEYSKLADKYTEEEFKMMQQLLDKANTILNKDISEISQEEVTKSLNELTTEKNNLDLISVKKELQNIIAEANRILSEEAQDYTEESIQALRVAVERAESVLDDPNVDVNTIKTNIEAVSTAIKALDPVVHEDVDKSVLSAFIKMVNNTNPDDYSMHSYQLFNDALITAQKVLADKDVKQSEVDKALSDLLNAYSNLKSSAPYAGLKAELDLAKNILDNSDLYVAETIKDLQVAYDNAMKIYASDEVNDSDIESATEVLRSVRILVRQK
ncbi:leucine-rich repeat protein [Amedibacterium intestinale]|jgi:hypothetical protein|uniref:leucine-rich repeat protein n=1 Tax=Amedibacterium intestinale TaxID=2583452 RepID=UPI003994B2CA